jgi:23S rRNA (adenine2503-C2)-methyltransferase
VNSPKPVLSGLPLPALEALFTPLPAFRARQVFRWIARGAPSFHVMSDLALSLREELSERFSLYATSVSQRLEDRDGTVKLQIALADGIRIEAVRLTDGEARQTACLSTQAGCPVACAFCKTGSLGFARNLSSAEIVEQFFHLRSGADIANIVVMGMGEPLLNLSALRDALAVLTDGQGVGLSKRRVTVSTSGVIAGIRDLADNGPAVRLACSLTTADSALREKLIPISVHNPLPQLHDALHYHQQKHGQRLTLEAVLLGGVNTRLRDAELMARFADGLDVVVNLIPWNSVSGTFFHEPSEREVAAFMTALEQHGLTVTRRFRKGSGIAGACGQLGNMQGDGVY